MVGIFLGANEIGMGAPVKEVFVGATKVWPSALPGINWPFPQTQAQANQFELWGGTTTAVSIVSSDFRLQTAAQIDTQGCAVPVAVTPGVQYIASMSGGNSSTNVVRYLRVGTTKGSTVYGEVSWPSGTWTNIARTITFTPTVSTIYVSLRCTGGNFGIATNFRNVSCVPT